jgi:putative oxidoreductase
MLGSSSGTRLVFPGLAGFYASMAPISDLLIRIVVGVMFLMHVWGKFNAGAARVATGFGTNYHLPMPDLFAYTAMGLELVGGACLIIGLFTRFFAAALAVEMGIALLVAHLPKGYAAGAGGFEYVLLIGVALLMIAMRGGGSYSVDAKFIGKEL